jgi:hypothetical protein
MKDRTAQAARARWRWWAVLIAIAVVIALGLGIALSLYQLSQTAPLMLQANGLPAGDVRVARQQAIQQFQADNLAKIWTTIVQAVVGVVLAIGGYFTWRNLRATQAKLEVDREAQITNRFTQAIDQLGAEKDGKPNLEVRLGGIYALERISKDSARDYWTIMEVLTAYVRQNALWSSPSESGDAVPSPEFPREEQQKLPKLRTDIEAIVTVIGRRKPPADHPEPHGLDLHATDLHDADLEGAKLQDVDLYRANLQGASLNGANLQDADLGDTNLQRVSLAGANLQGVSLSGANLHGAWLDGANLQDADLSWANLHGSRVRGANLQGASLNGAKLQDVGLNKANLQGASLDGANLQGARLGGANLQGVSLSGAELRGAIGLTKEQLTSAKNWQYAASLPDNLSGLHPQLRTDPAPPPWLTVAETKPIAAEPSASAEEPTTPAE